MALYLISLYPKPITVQDACSGECLPALGVEIKRILAIFQDRPMERSTTSIKSSRRDPLNFLTIGLFFKKLNLKKLHHPRCTFLPKTGKNSLKQVFPFYCVQNAFVTTCRAVSSRRRMQNFHYSFQLRFDGYCCQKFRHCTMKLDFQTGMCHISVE